MAEIIIGTREIIKPSLTEKLLIGEDPKLNTRNSNFARRLESPFRIAQKALSLNEAGSLKKFYTRELYSDLLENNVLDNVSYGKIKNYNFEVLAGFVFESFISRRINSYIEIKEKALKWILDERSVNSLTLKNIKAVVVGGSTTKCEYPDLYSFTNPNIDIIFINKSNKRYPPLIDQFSRYAGIQLKTVKSNYKKQVVNKIISSRILSGASIRTPDSTRHPIYRRVLTLLRDDNGTHSYDICKDIIYKDYKDVLSRREVEEVIENIASPEQLGLDQNEIDFYYSMVKHWHTNPNKFSIKDLDEDLINSLMILDLSINEHKANSPFKKHIIIPE